MNRFRFAASSLVILGLSSCASSEQSVEVNDPWVRFSGVNAAAYMTIENNTEVDESIVGVRVDPAVAEEVQLHEMVHGDGGQMTMSAVDRVELPAGSAVDFRSGGLHIMLENIRSEPEVGTRLPMTIQFESGETQTVDAEVRA